jgi:iron complex outermembrane receptor protein
MNAARLPNPRAISPSAKHWRRILLAVLSATLAVAVEAAPAPAGHVRGLGDLDILDLMNLEVDSVYGASRYVQKTTQAPASISVITADEIRRYGARSLDDVLNSVRGLYVPSDRNYSYLGVRGFQRPNDYNTRVLVLINGHRMNDNVYDLGATGREGMVNVELIERVEVIRGPSSSIYGSSAFFAVINVITKGGETFDGAEVSAEAGSFGTYQTRVTFGDTFANGMEWLISGSHYTSAGPNRLYFPEFDQRTSIDPRASNDGFAVGLDGEEASSFFTQLRMEALTFSAFWNGRTKEVPTASYETVFNDPREETEDYRSYMDVKYDRRLNDNMLLHARAFYDDYTYAGTYPYDFAEPGFAPDIVLSKDKTIGRWVGTEWQLTNQAFERHTIIVGGEYRNNLREYQTFYYETDPISDEFVDDRSSRTLGLFAQSETAIRSDLTFTAGVRYDDYSNGIGDTLNPRLALIYGLSEAGTLKALYGEAFRAPNPFERYYYFEQSNRPELRPETIRTYELVYERRLRNDYRLTISGYRYQVSDLISQAATSTGDLYFDNIDGARARGFEVEVDRQYDSGALLRASYALQKAMDEQSNETLTSSPRRIAKLNFSMPFRNDKLVVGLELQYHGSARTLRNDTVEDFITANLALFSRRAGKGFGLSGAIHNLFDSSYAYPGAEDHLQDTIEQNGRSFRGELSYRF